MAVFRNIWHEELTVGWNGRPELVLPDETVTVPDEIADDPANSFEGERFVRVDGGSPRPSAVDAPAPSPEVEAE